MGYSVEMKKAVIKKVLVGEKLHYEIAREAGISRSTLCNWVKHYRKDGNITLSNKEKRPQDWTSEERIGALIEAGSMSEDERISWCRKKGLFSHHLEQWKKDAITATTPNSSKGYDETRRLKKENEGLKKELLRKDKALAETAALLVLKKKAHSIWGDPEDD